MFVIYSEAQCVFVSGKKSTTAEYPDAMRFDTWGAASEFAANFGPDFVPMDADEVE